MELLHSWAVAPAAVGACCVAADRGRPRVPELATALLMTLAMLDVAVTGVIPAVWWAAALLASALALAAARRARGASRRLPHPGATMTVMSAAGLITMALLMVCMTPGGAAVSGAGHGHAADGVLPAVVMGAGYGAVAIVLAARRAPRLDRVQYGAMGLSSLLMTAAALA